MQFRVAVAVPVNRYNAVGIFSHNITVGVHAEGAHQIVVALGAVHKLGLVHFIGNMLKHLRRHFHAHADIHLVINKAQTQILALLGKPFRTGAPGGSN